MLELDWGRKDAELLSASALPLPWRCEKLQWCETQSDKVAVDLRSTSTLLAIT